MRKVLLFAVGVILCATAGGAQIPVVFDDEITTHSQEANKVWNNFVSGNFGEYFADLSDYIESLAVNDSIKWDTYRNVFGLTVRHGKLGFCQFYDRSGEQFRNHLKAAAIVSRQRQKALIDAESQKIQDEIDELNE